MLLMVSVKNACKMGWFPNTEKDILVIAKQVENRFCDAEDMGSETSYALSCMIKIISRFYPKMKLHRVLASFDVKPGYGAFVSDFLITKGILDPEHEMIWLLVARTDNMDTSSCIVSPPQVNFLLNGKGVQGRTNMEKQVNGPQLPTKVTSMLKYGINLLQAVGNFDGSYIIAIAILSLISSPEATQLQDYVQPVLSPDDSDSEVIELSSRISLNCPISQHRINIPVKGNHCKHPQCFDYNNFIEINSSWPSWRCRHCNNPVCYTDLRIDRNLVKILNEVGENVVDVMIFAAGSWEPVIDKEDQSSPTSENVQISWQQACEQTELPTRFSNFTSPAELHGGPEMNHMQQYYSSAPLNSNASIVDRIVARIPNLTSPSSLLGSQYLSDSASLNSTASIIDQHVSRNPNVTSPSLLLGTRFLSDSVSLLPNQLVSPYNLQSLQTPSPNAYGESSILSSLYTQLSGNKPATPIFPVSAQMLGMLQNTGKLEAASVMAGSASSGMPAIFPSSAPYDLLDQEIHRQQQAFWSHIASSVSAMPLSSMQHNALPQDTGHPAHNSVVFNPPSLQLSRHHPHPSQASTIMPILVHAPTQVKGPAFEIQSTAPLAQLPVQQLTQENWRSSERMRGSLRGKAWSAAYREYILQQSQPAIVQNVETRALQGLGRSNNLVGSLNSLPRQAWGNRW